MNEHIEKERWLRENTFQCRLGRVSKAQCQRNRERPELNEKAFANHRPTVCGRCNDWERLSEGLAAQDTVRGDDADMKGSGSLAETTMDSQQVSLVCECGKAFEPFKHGAVIVKKMCHSCYIKRIRQKKTAPAPSAKACKKPQRVNAPLDKAEPPSGSPVQVVSIPFSGPDEHLFKRVMEISRKERRTIEGQILYWLETHVPALMRIPPGGEANGNVDSNPKLIERE